MSFEHDTRMLSEDERTPDGATWSHNVVALVRARTHTMEHAVAEKLREEERARERGKCSLLG